MRALGLLLDGLIAALGAIWVAGGVHLQDRVILSHGADLRRAAILLAGAVAWALPDVGPHSGALRSAFAIWEWLKTRRGRWTALSLVAALAILVGCMQALALRVPMYDVGLFHQVLWSLTNGHGFLSTISGAGDFLRDHFSPALALLVPAYWIGGSSPLLLQMLHPALLFTGVAAWVWLAEQLDPDAEQDGRSTLAAAAALFGLCFDSLWGNFHWGFHENSIAFAALSWALALVIARPERRWSCVALFLVAAMSKEILLVDVALALGAWVWSDRGRIVARDSKSGIFFIFVRGALALALFAVFVVFERQPHPADKNYFDRYYAYLGHGLGDFAQTLLLSPWTVIQSVGALELAQYFVTVFAPWLFLPLITWKFARHRTVWLLALLPSMASAALATYPPLRGARFHYVLELWPVLAALTLTSLAAMGAAWGGRERWAVVWALFSLVALDRDPWGDLREYWRGALDSSPVRGVMAEIPHEDSVSADELSGAWLASRLSVTRWPARWEGCPKWFVLRESAQIQSARAQCGLRDEDGVEGWVIGRSK